MNPRPHIAVPPSRQTLIRFFREPRAYHAEEAAALVGWPKTDVLRRAHASEVPMRGSYVQWSDVAAWLLETWPLQWLMAELGEIAAMLPVGLQLTRAPWTVPFYIVHAMAVQWKTEALPHRMTHPPTVDDYVTDVLHRAIDADTLGLLQRDPEFAAAFAYPYSVTDE